MTRRRWVQIDGELIPADEVTAQQERGPMVIPDIQPYKSMMTGEYITSRSRHREHLKQHGVVEVGNETKYLQPAPKQLPPGLKQRIAEIVYQKLQYS